MQAVINGGRKRREVEERRPIGLVQFCPNLLISLGVCRLWQLVMNLVSSLLTEGLQVRVLPGEPFFTILRTETKLLQLEDFERNLVGIDYHLFENAL